ncbi:hypothetical protein B566_EDAN016341 [Ephemera danica]|nr:hypothetical protein B566_EDAN016341 [Ephemera danica]
MLNGRMLKHNESIQLKNGDVLGFSFRQFLFEYVAPTSIPGQKPTARRETIAPSTQTMPLVVQRTLSKISNRRASVPEDQLTPPSATLPDSIFEDSLVEVRSLKVNLLRIFAFYVIKDIFS